MILGRAPLAFVAALLLGCQAVPIATLTPTPRPSPRQVPTSSPTASPTLTPLPSDPRTNGWRQDLESLVTIREEIHPEPWHAISRDEYVDEVNAAVARIPVLNDDELLVELTRLASLPNSFGREGHGGFFLWGEGDYGVSLYPLRLYWFDDGIFVVDALAPHEDLIGARLERINGHEVDELAAAVEPLISRDNEQQVLATTPRLLLVANVLHGLGYVPDAQAPVNFEFSAGASGGANETAALEPVSLSRAGPLLGGHFFWTVPPRPDGPLWLSNLEDELWWEVDEATSTLFVGYNAVGPRLYFLIDDLTAIVESGEVDRLLVDLRHNGGGDNTTYPPLLDLVRDAAEDLPSGAYVAMGRATFSAAGNFVTEVERTSQAVLVGEDSGTSPNQYGDGRATTLPHTGLVFRVAARYTVKGDPDDERLTVPPDLPAPLTSTDYFSDRDPVMEAIVSR